MRTIDAKRVVSFQSNDYLFHVAISSQTYDGEKAHDIEAQFNGVSVGSIFIDREEDLVMLADALCEYVETRNLRRKEDQQ